LTDSSSTDPPFVSVIIPVRNEARCISDCLEAVLAQDYPRERMEVVVADGMSNDGTRDILRTYAERFPWVRVIDNSGGIVSTGLNAAIRAARGDVILRLDAHTSYATDYVRRCVTVLQETGADNVGGPWVAVGNGYLSRAIAAAFQSPFGGGGAGCHDPNREGEVDTVYLGCWPVEVFTRIGLFDEELVRNQDDEFNFRLSRKGGRVWQSPCIKSWYRPRASLAALWQQYVQYGYWKVRVIQKHNRPASIRHLVPGLFVMAMALLTLAAPFSTWAFWAWTGLVGLYLLCVVAASVLTARRAGMDLLPVLPAVYCCYHFGYGYGFLRGIWDFVLLRKAKPAAAFTTLTRPASNPTD
jgi:glycosyltransferase involved in cell wall biosynthesis